MDKLVSIIVPVYNSENFLEETVESVLRQEYRNWELILVNDGSTDSSAEIIDAFCKKDRRVQSITIENSGVSAARNRGFSKSKGDYIAFLDSDDVWLKDNLILKVNKLNSGDFGIVHGDTEDINEESVPLGRINSGKEGEVLNDILLWNGTVIPGPSSVLIKRGVLENIGLFDEDLSTAADQDIFIRIAGKYKVGRVPKVTTKYRIHQGNMHKGISAMERDVLAVFRKAQHSGLLKGNRRKSWGLTYRVLGASWWGDGQNPLKGITFLIRSVLVYPEGLFQILSKSAKKL